LRSQQRAARFSIDVTSLYTQKSPCKQLSPSRLRDIRTSGRAKNHHASGQSSHSHPRKSIRKRSGLGVQIAERIRPGKSCDTAEGVDHPHRGRCDRLAQGFGWDRKEGWEIGINVRTQREKCNQNENGAGLADEAERSDDCEEYGYRGVPMSFAAVRGGSNTSPETGAVHPLSMGESGTGSVAQETAVRKILAV
jgi:hypothetical protein